MHNTRDIAILIWLDFTLYFIYISSINTTLVFEYFSMESIIISANFATAFFLKLTFLLNF